MIWIPAAVLTVAAIAFGLGYWFGARSKVSDWIDGYRCGVKDERGGVKRWARTARRKERSKA